MNSRHFKHSFNLSVIFLFILIPKTTASCDTKSSSCSNQLRNGLANYPNYANLNTMQLIRMHGYPAEEHRVTTEDGYVLNIQRIPFSPKSQPTNTTRVPVLVMHGIFSSSAIWFWQPPHRTLVFMLADAGYDVWLGNMRGTSYSRGYVGSSPHSYWDFSYHEIGKYDLPAVINHIKRVSKQPSIYYIAHSLGTTQFFIFACLRPDMQSSIRTFFALSPIAYIGHLTNQFFRYFVPVYANIVHLDEIKGVITDPNNRFNKPQTNIYILKKMNSFCDKTATLCSACSFFILSTFGINPCQTNWTQVPGYLAHIPDAVSAKTLYHGGQMVKSGSFQHYDYGALLNLVKYRSISPPKYDWGKYRTPTVFFLAEDDNILTPKDVQTVSKALRNSLKETVKVKDFVHLDLVFGIDADKLVYSRIINIMNKKTYG